MSFIQPQSLTPVFTPGYWILSLSLSWMITSYPHLFFTWPILLPLPSFCDENLDSYFMNYRNKQTKKRLPQTTWLPLLICITTAYLLSSHHHYGSIIPIITVDPLNSYFCWALPPILSHLVSCFDCHVLSFPSVFPLCYIITLNLKYVVISPC